TKWALGLTGTFPMGICPKITKHFPKGKMPLYQRSTAICPKGRSIKEAEITQRVQHILHKEERLTRLLKKSRRIVRSARAKDTQRWTQRLGLTIMLPMAGK